MKTQSNLPPFNKQQKEKAPGGASGLTAGLNPESLTEEVTAALDRLLVFAGGVVLRAHHADRPLPLDGAAVVVQVVVVVGRRRGHGEHA